MTRLLIPMLCVCVAACTTSQPEPPRSGPPRTPKRSAVPERIFIAESEGSVAGRVLVPAAARGKSGRLVVWWELVAERPNGRFGWPLLMKLFERFKVLKVGPLTVPHVPFKLDKVPKGAPTKIYALLDTQGTFYETLLGGGAGNMVGHGAVQDAEATVIRLTEVPQRPRSEYCKGDRFRLIYVNAPYVAGTVRNPTQRRLCVYLPKSYASAPKRRYPVIYLLPGLGSTDRARMVGRNSARAVVDKLGADVILVGVDTKTVTGSTYFMNSAASGNWVRFARDMVKVIDAKFRTLAYGPARAVIGQSTGGYNALSMALRWPHLFGVVGASAPDALSLDDWLIERRGNATYIKSPWLAWMRFEAAIAPPDYRQSGQFISYAADWSPTSGGGAPYEWPVDFRTGAVKPKVYARWSSKGPMTWLNHPISSRRIRRLLSDRIFIAVGKNDEFDLYRPAKVFSDKLGSLGIAHKFVAGPGRHGKGQSERIRQAVEFALASFKRQRDR